MSNRGMSSIARFMAIASMVIVGSACARETPDVGLVDALYAPPAEVVEIVSLSRGQTFGGLLNRSMSANDQAALLLAFQEHASPRRMRQGTEITFRYLTDDPELRGVDVAISPDETVRLDRDVVQLERTALIDLECCSCAAASIAIEHEIGTLETDAAEVVRELRTVRFDLRPRVPVAHVSLE